MKIHERKKGEGRGRERKTTRGKEQRQGRTNERKRGSKEGVIMNMHEYLCASIYRLTSSYLASNDSLEYLNLSWNHLRRRGALHVANGLRVSEHKSM